MPILLRKCLSSISLIFTPLIVILPLFSDKSYSLSIKCIKVLFPLPVPPKIAKVLPAGIVKLIFLSTSCSLSYEKLTSSKTISPNMSGLTQFFALFSSSSCKIYFTRSTETLALLMFAKSLPSERTGNIIAV